jgi:hypothetical protein
MWEHAAAPMTGPAYPASTERVSTSGAWLGLAIAVRASLCVMSGLAGLLVTAVVTLAIDWTGSLPEAGELPPEVGKLLDLVSELTGIFEPYALGAGGAAIAIGILMFAASIGVVAGNDRSRRAARALLGADMLHSVAASAWLVVLWLGPLGDWNARLLQAVTDVKEAVPGSEVSVPAGLQASTALNLLSMGVSLVFSLGIAAVLCWLAGRPFARRWCEARGGGWTVATGTAPR